MNSAHNYNKLFDDNYTGLVFTKTEGILMNIDDLFALAKSRGLFWQSAEIYGGLAGIYDYGHLGTLIKRRFENTWLSFFVESSDNYYLIEGSTILPEKPLVSSGHAERFNDVIISCIKCHSYYRADVLLADLKVEVSEGATPEEIDKAVQQSGAKCPKCKGQLSKSKAFNMMMDLYLGPEKTDKSYLRPETAQSAYLNFFREFNIRRRALPMGIALIGKAYRNEISPRQGLYRMRELTQAELQIFFDPNSWKVDTDYLGNPAVNVVTYKKGTMEKKKIGELVSDGTVPEFYGYHMALIHTFYTKVLKVPKRSSGFSRKAARTRHSTTRYTWISRSTSKAGAASRKLAVFTTEATTTSHRTRRAPIRTCRYRSMARG